MGRRILNDALRTIVNAEKRNKATADLQPISTVICSFLNIMKNRGLVSGIKRESELGRLPLRAAMEELFHYYNNAMVQIAVANGDDDHVIDDDLKRRCSNRLAKVDMALLNMIFVPVLKAGHWWCAAISLSREQIGVIDSIDTATATAHVVHERQLKRLKRGMDELLQFAYPRWKVGFIQSLSTYTMGMRTSGKLLHNGLEMPATVKQVARRLKDVVQIEPVTKELGCLLHDDVLSEFNEEREKVLELLQRRMVQFTFVVKCSGYKSAFHKVRKIKSKSHPII